MLKTHIKRRAAQGARAVQALADIEASITALNDEDLLDLADIFSGETPTAIGDAASMEVKRRGLSL
ncbi:hypothetical protein FSB78_05235 [Sphingomonas ginsenosidivorax]|uniref:Uncharacterized protein n=1 Tax=Sphingomonas ginsenosidivorax TaxID=862135 RepID=A0A5C6UCH5_9SPHN|nr:hypothetical protein [Sphingomonas ginsenosidivorax]TXC70412.1 hypothetical protein FSB78_05235 [Sphingomonas ginsenosidivorax]